MANRKNGRSLEIRKILVKNIRYRIFLTDNFVCKNCEYFFNIFVLTFEINLYFMQISNYICIYLPLKINWNYLYCEGAKRILLSNKEWNLEKNHVFFFRKKVENRVLHILQYIFYYYYLINLFIFKICYEFSKTLFKKLFWILLKSGMINLENPRCCILKFSQSRHVIRLLRYFGRKTCARRKPGR